MRRLVEEGGKEVTQWKKREKKKKKSNFHLIRENVSERWLNKVIVLEDLGKYHLFFPCFSFSSREEVCSVFFTRKQKQKNVSLVGIPWFGKECCIFRCVEQLRSHRIDSWKENISSLILKLLTYAPLSSSSVDRSSPKRNTHQPQENMWTSMCRFIRFFFFFLFDFDWDFEALISVETCDLKSRRFTFYRFSTIELPPRTKRI